MSLFLEVMLTFDILDIHIYMNIYIYVSSIDIRISQILNLQSAGDSFPLILCSLQQTTKGARFLNDVPRSVVPRQFPEIEANRIPLSPRGRETPSYLPNSNDEIISCET